VVGEVGEFRGVGGGDLKFGGSRVVFWAVASFVSTSSLRSRTQKRMQIDYSTFLGEFDWCLCLDFRIGLGVVDGSAVAAVVFVFSCLGDGWFNWR
jgi:hypothetical protein